MTDSSARTHGGPLYNSRIILPYIQLLRKRYPQVDPLHVMNHAGMKPYEINDEGHWFSQNQIDRFYEEIVRQTGNPAIAREAGRYAASPESVGAMWQYVLGFLSPGYAYEKIGQTSSNFTRSADYESRRIASNRVEVLVKPRAGTKEKPFQCENRKGFFEAILSLFNNRLPEIGHPECVFKGDPACRYIISWEPSLTDHFRLLKNYLFLLFLTISIFSAIFFPVWHTIFILTLGIMAYLGMAYINEKLDKHYLGSTLANMRNISENLVEQIDINYNNTRVTREIGQVLNRCHTLDDVLSEVVGILEKRLDYDRGMIMLADKEKNALFFRAGYGYTRHQYQFLKNVRFGLDNTESRGVFVVSYRNQKPFLVNDINEIENTLSPRSLEVADRISAKAFICCPIICDSESLGILAVDNINTKRVLVQSDMSLLMGISNVIGIVIRHTEHIEAREKQLESVLQVMVSTIDARDPVTSGHSARVARYAVGICEELGLDREYREKIKIAALLHDYGKIGVPDSLLKKKERFTACEMENIKCHAEKTVKILEQMGFEGHLADVPFIAGSHHEKLDGSGYPNGLKGREIPLGARIIAVADYFEALTASRYYKRPLKPEKAVGMLIQNSGTHFDAKVVEAFIRHYHGASEAGPAEESTPADGVKVRQSM